MNQDLNPLEAVAAILAEVPETIVFTGGFAYFYQDFRKSRQLSFPLLLGIQVGGKG